MTNKKSNNGAALITVLIMVFIIVAIISNITIQNYRMIRRLSNQSFQDQAMEMFIAIVDFARAGLVTSGVTSPIDTLTDIWAQPIPQTPIPGLSEITIGGNLKDEQGKFNINDLVSSGAINTKVLGQFSNLLNYLNIPVAMAGIIANYMVSPQNQGNNAMQYTMGNPAYQPSGKKLIDLSELLLVKGMKPSWVFKLNQYVTAIPEFWPSVGNIGETSVNVNTASPEVISAKSGMQLDVAQRLVTVRQTEPFISTDKIREFLKKNGVMIESNTDGSKQQSVNVDMLDVKSRYFTVHAFVTSGEYQFRWVAMLFRRDRNGQWPVVLWQHPE